MTEKESGISALYFLASQNPNILHTERKRGASGSTGVWTQGLTLVGRPLPLKPLHQPFFVLHFFEIGSYELLAQAGFEPPASWSRPTE
jgi:hypothetical protein